MTKPSRKARRAKSQARTAGRRLLRELRGYAEALAVAFVIVTFAFTTVGVAGSSMEPNLYGGEAGGALVKQLLVGDRVFIPKYETWLRRAGVLGSCDQYRGPCRRGDMAAPAPR